MSIIKALQAQFNALTVPLPIIDMCDGNLYDALILSQIVYWHDGRLRVKKGGKLWLVKAYDEWEAETRVNARTARASIDRLKAKGIIETANHRFNGLKKVHIHLNEDVFNDLFTKAIESRFDIKSQTDVTPDVKPHVTPDVRPLTDTTTDTTTTNAAGVDDDKTTSQMIDEIPSAGWDSLTPAWQKVTPLIAEYYGLSESDGLCKVLACYFTRETRHIKKGSEWAEYHLDTALTVDQLKTLLQHWKTSLPAMPTKPMTIQANVSKWKNAQDDDKFGFKNPLIITH